MSLLFYYWTSITEIESPSKIFDWKIYLYSFLSSFVMTCQSSSRREKPPHQVEASFLSIQFQVTRINWEGWVVWVMTEFEVFDILNSLSSR